MNKLPISGVDVAFPVTVNRLQGIAALDAKIAFHRKAITGIVERLHDVANEIADLRMLATSQKQALEQTERERAMLAKYDTQGNCNVTYCATVQSNEVSLV